MAIDLYDRQILQMINYEPFSMTVGLTYASGALTATWAKLRWLSARSVDQGNSRLTSESHLDVPGRHSKTPAQEYMSLQEHRYLDCMKKRRVQTRNRYDLLDEPTLGTRISFSCFLVF